MTDVSAAIIRERKYVGGWELYRQIDPSTSTITSQRETLHVMDGQARVAIIDTNATESLVRYQYTNHLGTATLEVDDATNVITYEEYYPYGNTAFTTTQNVMTTKRYRYIGKERDDESGFYYMGARYYCPWLARWLAPDPINSEWYNITHGNPGRNKERQFVELTASSYEYCYANPIRFTDPSGEQPPPPIEYQNVHTTTTTGVNPTPANHPKQKAESNSTTPTQAFVGGGIGTKATKELVKNLPKGGEVLKDIGVGAAEETGVGIGIATKAAGLTIGLMLIPQSMGKGDVWPDGAAHGLPKPQVEEQPNGNPSEIKENDESKRYLYRFDTRSPDKIVKEGGFKAWGTNMDLTLHALGVTTFDRTSGYVSTSKSETALEKALPENAHGFMYKIKWQPHGIDVNEALGIQYRHSEEQEVAVPLFISALDIISVKPYSKK